MINNMILDVGEIKIDNIRELRLCLSTVIKSLLLRRTHSEFSKVNFKYSQSLQGDTTCSASVVLGVNLS